MNIPKNEFHIANYYIFGRPTTKKNHSTIIKHASGKRMIISSKQFRAYQEIALEQLAIQTKFRCTIEYAVAVRALYFFKDGRKADLNNLTQATADILQRAHILSDDQLIVSWDGSRMFYRCAEHVTRIEIYRMLPYTVDEYLPCLNEALALKGECGG